MSKAQPIAADNRSPNQRRLTELKVSGHLMTLESGLFCILQTPSHAADPASGLPGVRISVPPGPSSRREAVSVTSFCPDGWLSGIGDAALVRILGGPAQVLVTVYQAPNATEAPNLQVMRLLDGTAGSYPAAFSASRLEKAKPAAPPLRPHRLRLVTLPASVLLMVGLSCGILGKDAQPPVPQRPPVASPSSELGVPSSPAATAALPTPHPTPDDQPETPTPAPAATAAALPAAPATPASQPVPSAPAPAATAAALPASLPTTDQPGSSAPAPMLTADLRSALPAIAAPDESTLSDADRRRVQFALYRLGYYQARVDGVFGASTRSSIRRFQHHIGTAATGRLTPEETSRLVGKR